MTYDAETDGGAYAAILADNLRDVAADLGAVDPVDLVSFIRFGCFTALEDLVQSSTELFFKHGTLTSAWTACVDLAWDSLPVVTLGLEFRHPGVSVFFDLVPVVAGGERRATVRRRTRLRSGKVVGQEGAFVTECLIANRSAAGGLLRLPGAVPLPDRILVYDDQSGELVSATVVWRRERDFGIRFGPPARGARCRAIADSMRRKFYAVRG